jgi:hypothetical protein
MTDELDNGIKLPSGKAFTYPIDPKYPKGRKVTLQEAIELGFGGPSVHVHTPKSPRRAQKGGSHD